MDVWNGHRLWRELVTGAAMARPARRRRQMVRARQRTPSLSVWLSAVNPFSVFSFHLCLFVVWRLLPGTPVQNSWFCHHLVGFFPDFEIPERQTRPAVAVRSCRTLFLQTDPTPHIHTDTHSTSCRRAERRSVFELSLSYVLHGLLAAVWVALFLVLVLCRCWGENSRLVWLFTSLFVLNCFGSLIWECERSLSLSQVSSSELHWLFLPLIPLVLSFCWIACSSSVLCFFFTSVASFNYPTVSSSLCRPSCSCSLENLYWVEGEFRISRTSSATLIASQFDGFSKKFKRMILLRQKSGVLKS